MMGRRSAVTWSVLTFFLFTIAAAPLLAQGDRLDREFRAIPFNEWVASGKPGSFKWSMKLTKPQLSVHQRLISQMEVLVDGAELAKRRGQGEFVFFLQIRDAKDHIYQDHGNIDLGKVEEAVKASNITFSDAAFFLPGNYRVDVALYATATKEYGVRRATLHVAPLAADPFAASWSKLPAVEFRPHEEPPDSWYLPGLQGRVQLTSSPRKPLQIELIANITPSERDSGSLRVQDRNMSFLVPALKVLAQTEFTNSSVNVSLADLVRHKITFRQENVSELDWPRMRVALAGADPGVIDVKSLEKRQQKARFFMREINKRVGEKPSSRVLIILSSAVTFGYGEDLEPLLLETPTDCRVYYIRFQAEPARVVYGPQQSAYRRRRGPMPGQNISLIGTGVDQLAPMLKALSPKVFDVKSALEVRRALASILNDIARI
jgi:hypothetical protein